MLAVALLLGGCTTARYSYQVSENVDFTDFETYAILPANDTMGFSVYKSDIIHEKTVANIREEMSERGYSLETEDPDLLVLPHYMFEEQSELYYDPIYPPYTYWYPGWVVTPWYPYYYMGYQAVPSIDGTGYRQIEYTEGTIVIDVINQETNKLLWRGWSEDRVDPRRFTDDISMYVENIFETYPVND